MGLLDRGSETELVMKTSLKNRWGIEDPPAYLVYTVFGILRALVAGASRCSRICNLFSTLRGRKEG